MQYTAVAVAIKEQQTALPLLAGVALQQGCLASRMACLGGSLACSMKFAAQQYVLWRENSNYSVLRNPHAQHGPAASSNAESDFPKVRRAILLRTTSAVPLAFRSDRLRCRGRLQY